MNKNYLMKNSRRTSCPDTSVTAATQPIHHGGADSHLPLLLACVATTDGPVLEIGMGHVSTPVLHSVLCPRRRLVSLEDHDEFREMFQDYAIDGHEILPDNAGVVAGMTLRPRWGVVFIDDSPGGRERAVQVDLFLPVADYIVMHDAQQSGDNFEPVMEIIRQRDVPYFLFHNRYFPWTLAASMTRPIPSIP